MAKTHLNEFMAINASLDKIHKARSMLMQNKDMPITYDLVMADIEACSALGAHIISYLLNNNLRIIPKKEEVKAAPAPQKASAPVKKPAVRKPQPKAKRGKV